MGNMELLCSPCRGIGLHLAVRGKSHDFSRVASGPWRIFSSLGGDGLSKLVFVQRSQDSCLDTRDTSEVFSRLDREIRTLHDVRLGTQFPFPVSTEIMGFLSIFNRNQASSPFGALKSSCLSTC